jgi:lipoprotein NlpI
MESEWSLKFLDKPEYHHHLGAALLYTGRIDEAIRELRLAQAQLPEKTRIQAELGVALMLAQRYQEATEAFQQYLNRNDSPNLYHVLFCHYSLRHMGRKDAAIELLQRHLNRNDHSWETHLIQYHVGELSKEQLQALATNDCQHADARFYEGYRLLLDGQTREAKRIFTQYLDLGYYCFTETNIALMWQRHLNEAAQ